MLLARLWFFIIPSTLRSSITTVWFSPRILLTTWYRKLCLWFDICSYVLATANLALSLLRLPFCLRVNLRCKHAKRAEDLSKYFGFSKTEPFDKVANVFIPTSIPTNQAQTQALAAKIDLQTQIINDKFCQLEMREMQNTIQQLREEKQALATSAITQQQTQNIVSQLAPKAPVPAYVVQNPGCCYTPTVRVANECGCACGTTNAVL